MLAWADLWYPIATHTTLCIDLKFEQQDVPRVPKDDGLQEDLLPQRHGWQWIFFGEQGSNINNNNPNEKA
jgi:hypothetical protein